MGNNLKKGIGVPKDGGMEAMDINTSTASQSIQASSSSIPPHLDEFASRLHYALVESFGAE